MLVLDIISFVAFLIVLFLMWRKIKVLQGEQAKYLLHVSEELGNINRGNCWLKENVYEVQADIRNLKSAEQSNSERISNTFVKIGLLANTLGYEYQPDKTTPPKQEPAKFVKKQAKKSK